MFRVLILPCILLIGQISATCESGIIIGDDDSSTVVPSTVVTKTPSLAAVLSSSTTVTVSSTSVKPVEAARAPVQRPDAQISREGELAVPVETPVDCGHCDIASITPILNGPEMTATTEDLPPVDGCLRTNAVCFTIKTCLSTKMIVTSSTGMREIANATTVHDGQAKFACMADGKYAWNDFTGITSVSCQFEDCSEN